LLRLGHLFHHEQHTLRGDVHRDSHAMTIDELILVVRFGQGVRYATHQVDAFAFSLVSLCGTSIPIGAGTGVLRHAGPPFYLTWNDYRSERTGEADPNRG